MIAAQSLPTRSAWSTAEAAMFCIPKHGSFVTTHVHVQVDRSGIRGLASSNSSSCQQHAPEVVVDDPRQARRQLAADLSMAVAQQAFIASLTDAIADEELLRKCLLPITVTVQVSCSDVTSTCGCSMRKVGRMNTFPQANITILGGPEP